MELHSAVKAKLSLDSLTVYRGLLKDPLLSRFYKLLEYLAAAETDIGRFIKLYSDFFHILLIEKPDRCFQDYILNCITYDDNTFSRTAEKQQFEEFDPVLLHAAGNDLACLETVAALSSKDIKAMEMKKHEAATYIKETIRQLPEWQTKSGEEFKHLLSVPENSESKDWSGYIKELCRFHFTNGSGIFAKFKGFIWEEVHGSKGLKGITTPDPVCFSDLIGYNTQRNEVVENTLYFLQGYTANNILLYGDRGTGKSSTVKALLNEFHSRGLRIIELPKKYLPDLPEIVRAIKDRCQRFILFIDDLAFEDSEESYTELKAILEGGLESRPQNMVIYATSNRRHLIKEKFSDRAGLLSSSNDDEVRALDTLQEKLSLADRFGITVTFTATDQKAYLEIVEGLADRMGVSIGRETLRREALKWEISHNGRSPRTARQFIDWMYAKLQTEN